MLRIKAHNAMIMAAGIAFYATLALVPTLLALVSVYALLTEPDQIQSQINALAGGMDPETADLIRNQLATAVTETKSSGRVMLVVGLLFALFSASGAVQKLMLSINLAYGAVEGRKGWKVRSLAYLFAAAAISAVATMVFLLGALPRVMDEVDLSGPTQLALNILRFPLLGLAVAGGLTLLYRFGPDRHPKTPWRNPGSVVGTIAFLFFAGMFALYFSFAGGMPASYGILGSIAAIIIFFQLSAIAVIIGAEVNAVIEDAATLPLGESGSPAVVTAHLSDRQGSHSGDSTTTGPNGPVSFPKAMAAVAAIFILGRSRG